MILLENGDSSLLYTGDFKLRTGLSAEACEPRHADHLIMETTFGLPKYRFPPDADIRAGILAFCRETLARNETPILLAYSLGKARRPVRTAGRRTPHRRPPPVARMTAIYQDLGWRFPAFEPLDPATAAGRVVVAPPGSDLASSGRKLDPAASRS